MKKLAQFIIVFAAMLFIADDTTHAQSIRTWVAGEGDDANPCSRIAPCKTFAGAISKTSAGGEINVVNPGGYGPVSITKAITISAEGFTAGVLAANTDGIIINAGAQDVVVLRGLNINGAFAGRAGIRFLSGAALHVENCQIRNFTGISDASGIVFEPRVDYPIPASTQYSSSMSPIRSSPTTVHGPSGVGGSESIPPAERS
jgi:hypothetical protein